MTVIDVAAGPGFAAFELSGLVGPRGRVVALERSPSLAMALTMMAEARRLTNIAVLQTDIASFAWPEGIADVVWCRFALALLKDPVSALQGMVRALKPGGAILLQEAFDCRSWRLAPRSPEFESYVAKLIEKRRADGEEPEIGNAC